MTFEQRMLDLELKSLKFIDAHIKRTDKGKQTSLLDAAHAERRRILQRIDQLNQRMALSHENT